MNKTFWLILFLIFSIQLQAKHRLPTLEAQYIGNIGKMSDGKTKMVSSAQGLAVYGRYGFQFRNKGQCHIIDLKKKKILNTFNLKGNKSHCNNANWGNVKYNKQSEFPLLYISECKGKKGCMVTDIHLDGTNSIVQRIYYDDDTEDAYEWMDWVLDVENQHIYSFGSPMGGIESGVKIMRKFKLPTLADSDAKGEVHLKATDVLETFEIHHFPVTQGSCIKDGLAYLPEGYNPMDRKLNVFDMKTKKMVKTICLNSLAKEPEGCCIKGRWLYVSFHQTRTPDGTSFMRFKL